MAVECSFMDSSRGGGGRWGLSLPNPPRGSYPTPAPFFGRLLFKITGPHHTLGTGTLCRVPINSVFRTYRKSEGFWNVLSWMGGRVAGLGGCLAGWVGVVRRVPFFSHASYNCICHSDTPAQAG